LDVSELTYYDVDATDIFKNLLKKYGKDYNITFVGAEESESGIVNEEFYQNWMNTGAKEVEGGELELLAIKGNDDDNYQRA